MKAIKMKEQTSITQANIGNLTALWQKAATPFNGCYQSDDFDWCHIENSDWPNRLWFKKTITEKSIEAAKKLICSKKMIIPYWCIDDDAPEQIFAHAGFKETFKQVGMSLKLQNRPLKQLRLEFERVVSPEQATLWAETYPRGFGYKISEEIPLKTTSHIEFYLASYRREPAGTAIVYPTGDVVGIHGIGIIPEMRRQGFAEEIMEFVLNRAASLKASYATLQASVMGKGLYDKLGFKEDFVIKNFILDQS